MSVVKYFDINYILRQILDGSLDEICRQSVLRNFPIVTIKAKVGCLDNKATYNKHISTFDVEPSPKYTYNTNIKC